MKRTIQTLVTGLAVCAAGLAFAPKVSAATINLSPDDGDFLGSVNPGVPASEEAEAGYIDYLTSLDPTGETWDGTQNDNNGGDPLGQIYDRSDTACPSGGCPSADGLTTSRTTTSNEITVTGATYITAKYDGPNGGTLVWYVGGYTGENTFVVPTNWGPEGSNQYGLSGLTAFGSTGGGTTGPGGGGTPEPASLALFGLGLLGAGYRFRRRAANRVA